MKRWDKHQIDMCITSPPYFNLRDYKSQLDIWDGDPNCNHDWKPFKRKGISGGPPTKKMKTKGEVFQRVPDTTQSYCGCGAWFGSLGREPTVDMYIGHLCDIFDEVKRVLKPEGTLWVNIGDSYAGSGNGQTTNENAEWLKKSLNKGTIDSLKKSGGTTKSRDKSIPDKSLMVIPFRFAIEMVNRGWRLRNTIIWEKPSAMCSPIDDRFTVNFEYLFFFSKQQKYYFKQQFEKAKVQRLKVKPKFGGNKAKGYGNPTYSGRGYELRYEKSPLNKNAKIVTRNKRCVWSINTSNYGKAHFATFPTALIRTPIRASCPEGGIVLDPFMGSGSSAEEALIQGKQFVGIEISKEYAKLSYQRIKSITNQTRLKLK